MGKLPNFNYEVIKDYGEISNTGNQARRLRAISYNGHPAKYDLRTWIKSRENPDEEIMGKGLALTAEELYFLKEILDGMDLDEPIPQNKGFVTGGFTTTGFDSGVFG